MMAIASATTDQATVTGLVVSTSPNAASASTAPTASASALDTAPLVTGRCAVRLTWRSNSRSATSFTQQPALRIRMVPSVNTSQQVPAGESRPQRSTAR
jgi:hypothetical protein